MKTTLRMVLSSDEVGVALANYCLVKRGVPLTIFLKARDDVSAKGLADPPSDKGLADPPHGLTRPDIHFMTIIEKVDESHAAVKQMRVEVTYETEEA